MTNGYLLEKVLPSLGFEYVSGRSYHHPTEGFFTGSKQGLLTLKDKSDTVIFASTPTTSPTSVTGWWFRQVDIQSPTMSQDVFIDALEKLMAELYRTRSRSSDLLVPDNKTGDDLSDFEYELDYSAYHEPSHKLSDVIKTCYYVTDVGLDFRAYISDQTFFAHTSSLGYANGVIVTKDFSVSGVLGQSGLNAIREMQCQYYDADKSFSESYGQ